MAVPIGLVGVEIVSFEWYFHNLLVPTPSSIVEWSFAAPTWLVRVDVAPSE